MHRRRTFLVLLSLLSLAIVSLGTDGARAADPGGSDAAWAAVRAKVPRDRPVFRPTWLPPQFQRPATVANGPFFGISYQGDRGDLLAFTIGATNTCPSNNATAEPILVHGVRGVLAMSACSPLAAVSWTEAGESYSIRGEQGTGDGTVVSRDELLRIVAGLVRIEPDDQVVSPLTYAAGGNCFPYTNLCIAGPFRAYFEAHGGVAINGYPLTEEITATLEDGRVYQVQYFERTRLEFHPEYANTPSEILLGQFGRQILTGVSGAPTAPVAARPGEAFFAETGHNVGPRFAAYWQQNGGLAQFGYPLTEAFEQRLENGQTYTVQYFERARFELHPENGPPYDILLGQFGRQILATAPGK